MGAPYRQKVFKHVLLTVKYQFYLMKNRSLLLFCYASLALIIITSEARDCVVDIILCKYYNSIIHDYCIKILVSTIC